MNRRFALAVFLPILAACSQGSAAAGAGPQGRFGCTQSVYDSGSGMYQFQPRGYVEFSGGGYVYRGFENPSEGRIEAGANGAVTLRGGYLDGGEFVPMDDRPGQYTLTTPGFRWSCKA
ncbi:hypothetical protein [Arenimonas composti]|uniref:C-type lysozyme inhibitor domain-containing protein n=1 Tax=Arenimonas composti TR7-09 = DSM 18010 TaxID=1121013 RepID=A0A091BB03_9GAMM|nr:hypothetical protein [Arenimonas composti]KFN48692.1 hypothetical protein P873_13630 [Arenimonas composti TR7-09 = DSM 18010]